MDIRRAVDTDIPEIVELLKVSLGESLMPKSEAYWNWKHVHNPFGASPVLLAVDHDRIVGVRAFMRWEWKNNNDEVRAVRAVDTATHPDYQGKGIFKKLTLRLLDECKKEGVSMVFNTPNTKSKPGYLKMGWQEVGKLPVKLSLKRPVSIVKSKVSGKETKFLELDQNSGYRITSDLIDSVTDVAEENGTWNTKLVNDFLKWRYMNVPVVEYYANMDVDGGVIFRLKQSSLGVELRIVQDMGSVEVIETKIRELYKSLNFDYLSISGHFTGRLPGILKFSSSGPEVTFRESGVRDIAWARDFESWKPCLGDLELF